jgi:hypothetical protein
LDYYNTDIDLQNITYFEIEKGGYIEYEIDHKKLYVPNLGKIFVIIDHGNSGDKHVFKGKSSVLKKMVKTVSSIKIDNLLEQYTINDLVKINPKSQSIIDSKNKKYEEKGISDKNVIDKSIKKRIILNYMMKTNDKTYYKYPPNRFKDFIKNINLRGSLLSNLNLFDSFNKKESNVILRVKDD